MPLVVFHGFVVGFIGNTLCVCVMEVRERLKRKCEVLSAPSCLSGSERSDKPTFRLDRHQCNELHWMNYSHITGRKDTVWRCWSVWFSTSGNNHFYILTYSNRKQWYTHLIFPPESRESTTSEPSPSQLWLKPQHLLVLPPGSLESKLAAQWGLHIWGCCLGFFSFLIHTQSAYHFPVMGQNWWLPVLLTAIACQLQQAVTALCWKTMTETQCCFEQLVLLKSKCRVLLC